MVFGNPPADLGKPEQEEANLALDVALDNLRRTLDGVVKGGDKVQTQRVPLVPLEDVVRAAQVLDAAPVPTEDRVIHPAPTPDDGRKEPGQSNDLALRFNTGKPELHYCLTFPEALRGIARVTTYGSKKYALYNYTKGAPASQSIGCALRHLLAWMGGEDIDPESGQHHLDHFVWNAARLCDEMQRRPELDDRPHKVLEKATG